MNDLRKRAWALIATIPVVLGALVSAGLPPVHASGGIAFEVVGPRAAWSLPALHPGQLTVISGAHHLAVVSHEPWEFVLTSRLVQPPESAAPLHSAVFLGVNQHGTGGPTGTEWLRLSTQPVFVSRHGGPTGSDGEIFSLDLQIQPSWDDPPGVPIVAEVTATLAAGDAALSAYAHPPTIVRGSGDPVSFWYHNPEPGRAHEGATVRLDIWKDDVTLVDRRYYPIDGGEWHQIVWSGPAEGRLEVGAYRFRIVDAADRLLGSGIFHVVETPGVAASVGLLSAGPVATRMGAGVAATTANGATAGAVADVRVVAAGDAGSPGEPVEWTITVINPDPLGLVELQVDVCLPRGWSFLGADVPWVAGGAGGEGDGGTGACRTFLLGTLLGRREKKFRLELVYWPDDFAGRPPGRSDMWIRVTGAFEAGGRRVWLRETRIPLAPARDRLMSPPLVLHGRVFVDVNETGVYETGEPTAPGARIVVDGRELATANRRGEYRITLPDVPRVVWALSERGESRPVSVAYEELWAAGGRLDLPLGPRDAQPDPVPERSAATGLTAEGGQPAAQPGTTGYVLLSAKTDLGAKEVEAGARVRAGVSGSAGTLTLEVSDAGIGELLAPGRSPIRRLDDVRLSGQARDGAIDLQFSWESGLAREVRMGLLRPSKPAERAYRLKLDIDPRRLGASGSSGAGGYVTGSGYGPTYVPAAGQPSWWADRLAVINEWGYAQGDVWSCLIHEAKATYSAERGRITASLTRAAHERVERTGLKEEEASELRIEVDGGLQWSHQRWPVRLEASAGLPRKLTPSCGLSPFDGWRWRAIIAPPAGFAVQGIEWSGMSWPMARAGAGEPSVAGKAYELGISYRPVRWRGERIDVSTALQWEARGSRGNGGAGDGAAEAAGGESVFRLAARLRSRIGGTHDVGLELGALPLASTSNPNHLSRGDRRLALSWRVMRGDTRPWMKTELYSDGEGTAASLEGGLQIARRLTLPWTAEPVGTTLRASRSVDADDVTDKARLELAFGAAKGRWEWSGTAPLAAGQTSVVRSFAAASPGGSYEKTSRKLVAEGALGSGDVDWNLSWEEEAKPDERSWQAMFTVGGGTIKALGLSRWEAGVGRSASYKNGERSEAITSALRIGGRRGPWGVHVELLNKLGLYDLTLRHAAYDMTVRRFVGEAWSGLFQAGWRLAETDGSGWRFRAGLERWIGGPRVGLPGSTDPEEAGMRPGGSPVSGALAFAVGVVWEVMDGPVPGRGEPRFEAALTFPYLW